MDNSLIKIPVLRLWLLIGFMIGTLGQLSGQSCDFNTGQITLNVVGGNQTDQYNTVYAVTDIDGIILEVNNDRPEFDLFTEGFYIAYAINFREGTTVTDLEENSHIDLISADDCFDIGAPFGFTVCEEITICNYCLGETITLNAQDGNTSTDFTTKYVLTDNSGKIISIVDEPTWEDLDQGLYLAFSVNYDSEKVILGLDTALNIANVQSACLDIEGPFIIGICDQLKPTIFFDLKGCDITETALLQVGESFNSYLWSTGSRESFIIVSATEPATYTVTVTLDNGCVGVKSQTITGNEISRLGDFVWEDFDVDGRQDANEDGINGVRVNLYADFDRNGRPDFAGFPSCTTVTRNHPGTGEPGYYEFTLYQSNYVVEFVSPTGFVPTLQNEGDEARDSDVNMDGFTGSIEVGNGVVITNVDAGFRTTTSVCGIVWDDLDGDGRRDPEEEGIDGITLNIYTGLGELTGTTLTLTNPDTETAGSFCFDNLIVGDYYVEIILPDGRTLTIPNVGNDDDIDSDATGSNGPGTTDVFSNRAGETATVDFGIYTGGVVCGIVWRENEQGTEAIYDEGIDSTISNSQVLLVDANSEIVVLSGITGDDGRYCINGIPIGSYKVLFRANSAGESYVQPRVGDDPLIDSDVDINTGTTGVFFVPPVDTIKGVNAGLRLEALPIEMVSFEGYYDKSKRANILDWITATEINNDRFEIERAIDDEGSFALIGMVDGNGTTTSLTEYQFSDKSVVKSGTYYYRLKQVDYNGGFEYSQIIAIDVLLNDQVTLNVFPNPVTSITHLEIVVGAKDQAEISMSDLLGREVRHVSPVNLYTGRNLLDISCQDLPNGSYLVNIKIGAVTKHKLIQIAR